MSLTILSKFVYCLSPSFYVAHLRDQMIAVTGVKENDSPRNENIGNFCFSYFIFSQFE